MSSPTARIDLGEFCKLVPEAFNAMMGVAKVVEGAFPDQELLELVKLRVSQINGCAFCLQYHLAAARKLGVSQTKLDAISAWHDSPVFSDKERATLAWAETLTKVSTQGAPTALYEDVKKHHSDKELALLTMSIGGINSWNRLGIAFRFMTMPPQ